MVRWWWPLEAAMTDWLYQQPALHRLAEKAAKNVHRIRHGLPKEEAGGTRLDSEQGPSFSKHFYDELKTQLGRAESQNPPLLQQQSSRTSTAGKSGTAERQAVKEEENAHEAWENTRRNMQDRSVEAPGGKNRGFMGEYIDALHERMKSKGKESR